MFTLPRPDIGLESDSNLSKYLPVVSGNELVRALKRTGFEQTRQRGSHVILERGSIEVAIPNTKR